MTFYQKTSYHITIITILSLVKFYFLYLNVRPLESYFSNFLFIYYNSKNFFINPHSFYDWNHLGTPIYYIGNIILHFTGEKVKHYDSFNFYFHLFNIAYLVFSCLVYLNYFKKKRLIIQSFFFLILLFSYQEFFMSLEVLDPISLLIPTIILVTVYFHKIFYEQTLKKIKIIKFAFFLALLTSIKSVMMGLTITISVSTFYYLLFEKKNIKNFFIFFFSIIIIFALLNFPILGRVPVTIYNILFENNSSLISNNFRDNIASGLLLYFDNNPLLFFTLLISLFLGMSNIFTNKFISLKICQALSIFFFLYTMLYSFNVYGASNTHDNSFILRNHFIYIFFINCFLYDSKLIKKFNKYKIFILPLGMIIFLLSFINYNHLRTQETKLYIYKKNQFLNILNKFNQNNNIYLYKSPKFTFHEILLHYSSNEINSGKLFTNEIKEKDNRFRWIHAEDIIFNFKKRKGSAEIKNLSFIYTYDNFLKKKLNNFFYNSFSFFSLRNNNNLINNTNRKRILLSEGFHGEALLIYPVNTGPISKYKKQFYNYIKNNYMILDYSENKIFEENWAFIKIKNK